MSKGIPIACVLLLVSLSSPVLYAQNVFASITGTISDESGAVVPRAKVSVVNTDTGLSREVTVDERGDYLLAQLPEGKYTLSAEIQGFRKEQRAGIVLQVNQRAREDIRLKVGAITETMEVTAGAASVDSETSTGSQVVNTTQVTELPLNSRDFTQLPLLSAGVAKGAALTGSIADNTFSTAGNRPVNNCLLDGVETNDVGPLTVAFTPSEEMIQEFRLEQNLFAAESGRYSGGQVNLTTKSGPTHSTAACSHFCETMPWMPKTCLTLRDPRLGSSEISSAQVWVGLSSRIRHSSFSSMKDPAQTRH
jgi:hypothetical protein